MGNGLIRDNNVAPVCTAPHVPRTTHYQIKTFDMQASFNVFFWTNIVTAGFDTSVHNELWLKTLQLPIGSSGARRWQAFHRFEGF